MGYANEYARKISHAPGSYQEVRAWSASEAANDLAAALASVGWATYAEAVAARCARGCDDATRAKWQTLHARWSVAMKTRAGMPIDRHERAAAT